MENNDPSPEYNEINPEGDIDSNPPRSKDLQKDPNRARPKSAKPPSLAERKLASRLPGKSPIDDFDEHKFKVQFQHSLDKISQNETRDIGLKELQNIISNNPGPHHLRVYFSSMFDQKRNFSAQTKEVEVLVLGFIALIFKKNLLDPIDKPPNFLKSVVRLCDGIFHYFKTTNRSIQVACSRALLEVYMNCMPGEPNETVLLMMFEPLYLILNAGADRPTQQTAALCLLEIVTVWHGRKEIELIHAMAPKMFNLILKSNHDLPELLKILSLITEVVGTKYLGGRALQGFADKILAIIKNPNNLNQYYVNKIEACCLMLELGKAIMANKPDDKVLTGLYETVLPVLADASKNKIFKVQQAGSEAHKCWQALKNNEEYKGSGARISAIERSPEKSEPKKSAPYNPSQNFKMIRDKLKMEKLVDPQRQDSSDTNRDANDFLNHLGSNNRGQNFLKARQGTGGGYVGWSSPPKDNAKEGYEKKKNQVREMILQSKSKSNRPLSADPNLVRDKFAFVGLQEARDASKSPLRKKPTGGDQSPIASQKVPSPKISTPKALTPKSNNSRDKSPKLASVKSPTNENAENNEEFAGGDDDLFKMEEADAGDQMAPPIQDDKSTTSKKSNNSRKGTKTKKTASADSGDDQPKVEKISKKKSQNFTKSKQEEPEGEVSAGLASELGIPPISKKETPKERPGSTTPSKKGPILMANTKNLPIYKLDDVDSEIYKKMSIDNVELGSHENAIPLYRKLTKEEEMAKRANAEEDLFADKSKKKVTKDKSKEDLAEKPAENTESVQDAWKEGVVSEPSPTKSANPTKKPPKKAKTPAIDEKKEGAQFETQFEYGDNYDGLHEMPPADEKKLLPSKPPVVEKVVKSGVSARKADQFKKISNSNIPPEDVVVEKDKPVLEENKEAASEASIEKPKEVISTKEVKSPEPKKEEPKKEAAKVENKPKPAENPGEEPVAQKPEDKTVKAEAKEENKPVEPKLEEKKEEEVKKEEIKPSQENEKKMEEKKPEEQIVEEKKPEEKVSEDKKLTPPVVEEKKPEEKKPEEKKPEEVVKEDKKPDVQKPEEKSATEKIPEEKKPEEVVKEDKKPDVQKPEEKSATEKIPEEKKPEDKPIEENKPQVTKPEEKQPEEKQLEASKPQESKVEEKKPEEATKEEKKPEEKKPEEKKPEEKKPEEKKPEEKPPVEIKPEEKQPEGPKPEDKKPEEPKLEPKKVEEVISESKQPKPQNEEERNPKPSNPEPKTSQDPPPQLEETKKPDLSSTKSPKQKPSSPETKSPTDPKSKPPKPWENRPGTAKPAKKDKPEEENFVVSDKPKPAASKNLEPIDKFVKPKTPETKPEEKSEPNPEKSEEAPDLTSSELKDSLVMSNPKSKVCAPENKPVPKHAEIIDDRPLKTIDHKQVLKDELAKYDVEDDNLEDFDQAEKPEHPTHESVDDQPVRGVDYKKALEEELANRYDEDGEPQDIDDHEGQGEHQGEEHVEGDQEPVNFEAEAPLEGDNDASHQPKVHRDAYDDRPIKTINAKKTLEDYYANTYNEDYPYEEPENQDQGGAEEGEEEAGIPEREEDKELNHSRDEPVDAPMTRKDLTEIVESDSEDMNTEYLESQKIDKSKTVKNSMELSKDSLAATKKSIKPREPSPEENLEDSLQAPLKSADSRKSHPKETKSVKSDSRPKTPAEEKSAKKKASSQPLEELADSLVAKSKFKSAFETSKTRPKSPEQQPPTKKSSKQGVQPQKPNFEASDDPGATENFIKGRAQASKPQSKKSPVPLNSSEDNQDPNNLADINSSSPLESPEYNQAGKTSNPSSLIRPPSKILLEDEHNISAATSYKTPASEDRHSKHIDNLIDSYIKSNVKSPEPEPESIDNSERGQDDLNTESDHPRAPTNDSSKFRTPQNVTKKPRAPVQEPQSNPSSLREEQAKFKESNKMKAHAQGEQNKRPQQPSEPQNRYSQAQDQPSEDEDVADTEKEDEGEEFRPQGNNLKKENIAIRALLQDPQIQFVSNQKTKAQQNTPSSHHSDPVRDIEPQFVVTNQARLTPIIREDLANKLRQNISDFNPLDDSLKDSLAPKFSKVSVKDSEVPERDITRSELNNTGKADGFKKVNQLYNNKPNPNKLPALSQEQIQKSSKVLNQNTGHLLDQILKDGKKSPPPIENLAARMEETLGPMKNVKTGHGDTPQFRSVERDGPDDPLEATADYNEFPSPNLSNLKGLAFKDRKSNVSLAETVDFRSFRDERSNSADLLDTQLFESGDFTKKLPSLVRPPLIQNEEENKRPPNSVEVWKDVLGDVSEGAFDKAYSKILELGDDIYLMRLMKITGPVLKKLHRVTAVKLMKRMIMIQKSNAFERMALNVFESAHKNKVTHNMKIEEQNLMLNILYGMSAKQDNLGPQSAHLYHLINTDLKSFAL